MLKKRSCLGLCSLMVLVVAGCGYNPLSEMRLVTGEVTFNGEPIPEGLVSVISLDYDPELRSRRRDSGRIVNGKFQVFTTIGRKTVSFTAYREVTRNFRNDRELTTMAQYIPTRYNQRTELRATVLEDGETRLRFDLEGGSASAEYPRVGIVPLQTQ